MTRSLDSFIACSHRIYSDGPSSPFSAIGAKKDARPTLLAWRPMISIERKDGHSQRDSLANNLPANAADMVKAVHGQRMGKRGRGVKGILIDGMSIDLAQDRMELTRP